jgi:hypothetical protein
MLKKNFLSKKEHKDIYSLISGSYFPYFAKKYQLSNNKKATIKYEHLFTHIFMDNEKICSDWFEKVIIPFALRLPIDRLLFARMNLLVNQGEPYKSGWHTDFTSDKLVTGDCVTAVYYFNTNNGATEIKGEKPIKSIANSMLSFPSNKLHRSIQHTDTTFRYVLNLNYLPRLNGR